MNSKEKEQTDEMIYIEIWKETVEVQKHFNEIELKIRNLAVTAVGVFLGAIGYAYKEDVYFVISNIEIHLAVFLGIGALIVLGAFYFMDRFWYHPLLLGAVKYGEVIEKSHPLYFSERGLTSTISKHSPVNIWKWTIHSKVKFHIFYGLIAIFIAAIIAVSMHNSLSRKNNDSEHDYKEKVSLNISSCLPTSISRPNHSAIAIPRTLSRIACT